MKIFVLTLLIFLVGCCNYENDKIDVDMAKNNKLLVPPCLNTEKK